MLDKKQNVFERLRGGRPSLDGTGWTQPRFWRPGALQCGLLVSTALTQQPELFRVVLPTVP